MGFTGWLQLILVWFSLCFIAMCPIIWYWYCKDNGIKFWPWRK